jgi:hypothetical protein
MAEFTSQLARLGKGPDTRKMLGDPQKNGTAAIECTG